MNEMTAVELGGDLHGQLQSGPHSLDQTRLRHGANEVTAQTDKSLHCSRKRLRSTRLPVIVAKHTGAPLESNASQAH
jgi:hypothetical protein